MPDFPRLSATAVRQRLQAMSPEPLAPEALAALEAHYRELRRWAPHLGLVGRSDLGRVLERHYGESLAALPLVPRGEIELVDLGSGAGFPGLVLAATRRRATVTLVESRQRKWAFLRAAARRAQLPCHCLNARVGARLPEGMPEIIDLLTIRAVKLEPAALGALLPRMAPRARLLLWLGAREPELPPAFTRVEEVPLPGTARSRILCVELA